MGEELTDCKGSSQNRFLTWRKERTHVKPKYITATAIRHLIIHHRFLVDVVKTFLKRWF